MKEALKQPLASRWPLLWDRILEAVGRRRRLLLALAAVILATSLARVGQGANAGNLEASLSRLLQDEGIELVAGTLRWTSEGEGLWGTREVLFLAQRPGEHPDVYYAEVTPGSNGSIGDMDWLSNLTRTSSAEEMTLVQSGTHVAYLSRVGDEVAAVTVLDPHGEPLELTAEWSRRARFQNGVTNLQETGRWAGVGRYRYRLNAPVADADLRADNGNFVLRIGDARVVLAAGAEPAPETTELLEFQPMAKGMPGTLTWVVDTVRNLSIVGPEPIEWLEHRVFGVKDWAERMLYALAGTDRGTEEDAAEELGVGELTESERRRQVELSITDPELGWPPPPMDVVIRGRALEGEGEWMAVVDDPFVAHNPNAPPAFFQSFLRVDPERRYARVYVTLWDPRQVQLHIMSGTREPESATGETASGMAPREPTTLSRLVGGFNGGFQSLHGEFGMKAEGKVYLPPKPWSATVAVRDDGTVLMGSWMPPPAGVRTFEEGWAVAQIPADMVSLRQNLTSVVEDRQYNPWGRWWWGAAPENADEQTFIDRSGLCLTDEGFLAYFWGQSIGPEGLGRAMVSARCARGMHLDMNSRHTGFEFYNVRPRSDPHPPLGRELTDSEYEGPVPLAENYVVRARKMVRSMTPVRFPRYVGRDGRDFFYLTLNPVLPGSSLGQDAGQLSTRGLPHGGWPHAFARGFLGESPEARTWIVRLDPQRAPPAPVAPAGAVRPLAYLSHARDPSLGHGLYATRTLLGYTYAVGDPPPGATPIVSGPPLASTPDAGAALGLDGQGFIVYGERLPGDPIDLIRRLREAGVSDAVALSDDVRLAFAVDGQFVAPDTYERLLDPELGLPFMANETPRAEILFPDVRPRPYWRWARMQDTRVRYFRETPPTFSKQGGGLRDSDLDAGVSP